jgi:hypothetical protein
MKMETRYPASLHPSTIAAIRAAERARASALYADTRAYLVATLAAVLRTQPTVDDLRALGGISAILHRALDVAVPTPAPREPAAWETDWDAMIPIDVRGLLALEFGDIRNEAITVAARQEEV